MTKIWALADLHLAISCPEKDMAVFGPAWEGYMEKMAAHWSQLVAPEDLILLPGDITWAMRMEEARRDLAWIDALPGTKIMIRGNHDYWWSSFSKVRQALPPSLHALHHSAMEWQGISICGTRLWDDEELDFSGIIRPAAAETPIKKIPEEELAHKREQDRKIFERELGRLERACEALNPAASLRICMVHYPPIGLDLAPSRASEIFEAHGVEIVLFGHLHNIAAEGPLFGESRGVRYHLTSADWLEFKPLWIHSIE